MTDAPPNKTVVEVLASNVKRYRGLREFDQERLAFAMRQQGHAWRQVTVSEVERFKRNVTVPELVALTIALAASVEQLLDPRGPEGRTGPHLALADRIVEITGDADEGTLLTAVGPLIEERRPTVAPAFVSGLVCSHKYYAEVVWDEMTQRIKGLEITEGRPGLTDVGPDGPMP